LPSDLEVVSTCGRHRPQRSPSCTILGLKT